MKSLAKVGLILFISSTMSLITQKGAASDRDLIVSSSSSASTLEPDVLATQAPLKTNLKDNSEHTVLNPPPEYSIIIVETPDSGVDYKIVRIPPPNTDIDYKLIIIDDEPLLGSK